MQITKDEITEIFYLTDEFCNEFNQSLASHTIGIKLSGYTAIFHIEYFES